MSDIAPELYEAIKADFEHFCAADEELTALANAADYAGVNEYATRLGDYLADAFAENLFSGVLPDGKMYYNIAERVVRPMLTGNYELVTDVAAHAQTALNSAAGIGIRPVVPELNESRVSGIINKLAKAEQYDDAASMLGEPVVNFTQSIVDDSIRANAEFHAKSGLSPKISRTSTGKCCDWCNALAGTYPYGEEPKDFYRRHNYCRCMVLYNPGNGKYQDAHSKKWYDTQEDTAAANRKRIAENLAQAKNNSSRPFAQRGMANGPRRGRLTIVTEAEEIQIREWADELKIPQEVLSFNTGGHTSFDDDEMVIHIRGDVFPADYAENYDSILNARCAIAHEYYGHYQHHPSNFPAGDWRDEFRASYRASIDTPNLTISERQLLMIDAFERARNAGITVRLNDVARRMLYEA